MKIILMKISVIVTTFFLGWTLSYLFREPKTVIIYQDKIVTNTITKNVKDMSCEEAKDDLLCFYTRFPTLELKYISDDEYLQIASLCERKWERKTTITSISKQYRNLVIAGLFFDSQMRLGFQGQYYRMFGSFGIGGSLSWTMGYGSLSAGVVLGW